MAEESVTYILQTHGDEITDGGLPVRLRGIGIAGWLNMENWITGYPGHEQGQRDAVTSVLGQERADFFFERFCTHFFDERDAALLGQLGFNVVRIPVHYRLFEDDDRPFEIKESGFRHLDRAIALCGNHGIRTIIDLHSLPGWQNQDWHCDNPTTTTPFWQHRHFQDRVVNLWREIATRYRHDARIAAYNPMNEPADPTGTVVGPFSRRLVEQIRDVDSEHIIILEGNRYSHEFEVYGESLPNVIYSIHEYPPPAFMPDSRYPGYTYLTQFWESADGRTHEYGAVRPGDSRDQYFDKPAVERGFFQRSEYMRSTRTPIFVGEFNVVFTGDPVTESERLALLGDQLDIYFKNSASWAYWPYKDIGVCAPVNVHPDSLWIRRIRPVLEKKKRLGADEWGGRRDQIAHIMRPVEELFGREFPNFQPFPFGRDFLIRRAIPETLFAGALQPEFGELFRNMTDDEIDDMMRSFRLENCTLRQPLVDLLREACTRER